MNSFNVPKNFVIPGRELKEISSGFLMYNSVLLTGVSGIGKTALANYIQFANPFNFKEINYFNGAEFDFYFNESKILTLNQNQPHGSGKLIIIDDFNQIFKDSIRQRVVQIALQERKNKVKFLITTRPDFVDDTLLNNSFHVNLEGWSKSQIITYLKDSFQQQTVSQKFINEFNVLASNFENNPSLIEFATALIKREKIKPSDLLFQLNNNLEYRNNLLDRSTETLIILPDPPKLITDISLINTSILEIVNRNPQMIYQMSSRQFEEFVAELFEKEGYRVSLTKATRDGGKDLLIVEERRIGNFIIYVECKNYSMSNPVGVRLVRELYGAVMADRVTAGVLVTSSYFSSPAVEFKEQVKSQLSLLDYYDLKKWISEINDK